MKKKELDTETAQQALPIKKRLLSLDALRGTHTHTNELAFVTHIKMVSHQSLELRRKDGSFRDCLTQGSIL